MGLKQVVIVRNDLKMPKGKLSAQVAHASVDAVLKASRLVVSAWKLAGMKKSVLKVESEEDLRRYYELAKSAKLPCSYINDAGRTCLAPGTATCVGIGPASDEQVDKISGDLKLL